MNNETIEALKEKFLCDVRSGITTFDTWGNKERACMYNLFKEEKLVKIDEVLYHVQHKEGGGAGMGAYPAIVIVSRAEIKELF